MSSLQFPRKKRVGRFDVGGAQVVVTAPGDGGYGWRESLLVRSVLKPPGQFLGASEPVHPALGLGPGGLLGHDIPIVAMVPSNRAASPHVAHPTDLDIKGEEVTTLCYGQWRLVSRSEMMKNEGNL